MRRFFLFEFKGNVPAFPCFQNASSAVGRSIELKRMYRIPGKIAERLVVDEQFNTTAFVKDFSRTDLRVFNLRFDDQHLSVERDVHRASVFQFEFRGKTILRRIRNQGDVFQGTVEAVDRDRAQPGILTEREAYRQ